MKSLLQKTRINELIEQRNGYLVLASGLLILCLLLTGLSFYLGGRERVILVPPQISKTFWISNSEVSPEYIAEMTAFFSWLRFNLTPASVDFQNNLLLRYVNPRFYNAFKNQLVAEADRIKGQRITTAFYTTNIQSNSKKLTAIITGDLITNVENTELPKQRVSYQIQFDYDNGRLMVEDFKEVKNP